MKRLVCSLFAVAFALSFNACEQQDVSKLPPHYQHEIHGAHPAGENHPAGDKHEGGAKDVHAKGAAAPAHPEAKPAEVHQ